MAFEARTDSASACAWARLVHWGHAVLTCSTTLSIAASTRSMSTLGRRRPGRTAVVHLSQHIARRILSELLFVDQR